MVCATDTLKRFMRRTAPCERNRVPRVCFTLQVRPDRLAEYRERHAAVWPEMLRALADTGWHNYSLFLRDDGLLIGYVETPSIAQAQAGMAATEVNARWQAEMSELFEDLEGLAPDEGFLVLEEVFHLEDQLAAVDDTDRAATKGDELR
jgi:L-rhamnose mutarotase